LRLVVDDDVCKDVDEDFEAMAGFVEAVGCGRESCKDWANEEVEGACMCPIR
jgi:hypothetical protein